MVGYGFLALLITLLSAGGYGLTGNAALLILACLAGFITIWDGTYYLTAQRQLSAVRQVDRREIPWGGQLMETVTLANLSGRRARVAVIELTNLPSHDGGFVIQMPPHSTLTEKIPVICERRGPYYLGALDVTYPSPLGAFPRGALVGQPIEILVLPRVAYINRIALPVAGLSLGEETGQGKGDMPPLVRTLREYMSGDPPNHIAWRKSAQIGTLLTKVMEPQVRTALHLVVDAQCLAGSDTEEVLATVAASVATFAINQRHLQVGLVAPMTRGMLQVMPARDGQLRHLQRGLARLTGDPTLDLPQRIDHILHARRGQVVILLTPEPPAAWATHLVQWQRQGLHVGVIAITTTTQDQADSPPCPVPKITVPSGYADPAWTDELIQLLEHGNSAASHQQSATFLAAHEQGKAPVA